MKKIGVLIPIGICFLFASLVGCGQSASGGGCPGEPLMNFDKPIFEFEVEEQGLYLILASGQVCNNDERDIVCWNRLWVDDRLVVDDGFNILGNREHYGLFDVHWVEWLEVGQVVTLTVRAYPDRGDWYEGGATLLDCPGCLQVDIIKLPSGSILFEAVDLRL